MSCGRLLPSRSRSQLPPVFAPKPTASRRFADEMLARFAVVKRPTLALTSMSAESDASPVAVVPLPAA